MSDVEVTVGSVWDDQDPREAGRTVEVLAINGAFAVVRLNTPTRNVSRKSIGRKSTIRLDRFGTDYTPSDTAPHRTGRHKETGELGYWPVTDLVEQ